MTKIYFRRQATPPVTGTNGIFTICTGNKTLYMDGEEYGGGGTISGITLDTWFKERVNVPIVDKVAQIDLTDMARQVDVKRLLDDVFVIKQELELNGPLDPHQDPRSAIDILHDDVTNIQRDLNGVKDRVSANSANIKENYEAIIEMGDDLLTLSSMVSSNTKNIAVNAANIASARTDLSKLEQRVGKLEGRERDLTYSAETAHELGQQNKNKILILEDETITGVTLNGVAGTVSNRVVSLTAKTYDEEISGLNDKILAVDRKANKISGDLSSFKEDFNQFIDEIASDIETISGEVDTKISGVTLNGKQATIKDGVAELELAAVDCVAVDRSITVATSTTEDNNTTYSFKAYTDEITEYLYGLLEYQYGFSATPSPSAITITLTAKTSAETTVTLASGRYRGKDYPTYDKDNMEPVEVVSSSANTGWVAVSGKNNQFKYTYTHSDLSAHTAPTISFSGEMENTSEQTGTATTTIRVTINKPWFTLGGTTTPTAEQLNAAMNSGGLGARGDGTVSNKNITFKVNHTGDFYFFCAPSNCSVKYTESNNNMLSEDSPVATVNTIYGPYRIYKSKAKQTEGENISGVLTVSRS